MKRHPDTCQKSKERESIYALLPARASSMWAKRMAPTTTIITTITIAAIAAAAIERDRAYSKFFLDRRR